MADKKIADNVNKFSKDCSLILAEFAAENFEVNHYFFFQENPVDSPIEQIFYLAFSLLRETNYITKGDAHADQEGPYMLGLSLHPQVEIGDYRVDFIGTYHPRRDQSLAKKVIVECDSQQFHERDEKERRYEKKRDRFLQAKGYTVFRFTGSEIVKEPFRVAAEVISFLTGHDVENLQYSVENYKYAA